MGIQVLFSGFKKRKLVFKDDLIMNPRRIDPARTNSSFVTVKTSPAKHRILVEKTMKTKERKQGWDDLEVEKMVVEVLLHSGFFDKQTPTNLIALPTLPKANNVCERIILRV